MNISKRLDSANHLSNHMVFVTISLDSVGAQGIFNLKCIHLILFFKTVPHNFHSNN